MGVTSKTFEQIETRIRNLMNDTDRGDPAVSPLMLKEQVELCIQQMAEDKVLGTNDTGSMTYADGEWQKSPDAVFNATDPNAFPAGSQVLAVIRNSDNFPLIWRTREWIDWYYSSSPTRPKGTVTYWTLRFDTSGATWIDVAPTSQGNTPVNVRFRYVPLEITFPGAQTLGVNDQGLMRVLELRVAERLLRSLPEDQLAKIKLALPYVDQLGADAKRLEQAVRTRILLSRRNDNVTEASA